MFVDLYPEEIPSSDWKKWGYPLDIQVLAAHRLRREPRKEIHNVVLIFCYPKIYSRRSDNSHVLNILLTAHILAMPHIFILPSYQ
jgi:hypothetical protein